MAIGTLSRNVRVSEEYQKLAEEDEQIARLLHSQYRYRHAIYFTLQAMEKFVRARIFRLADPFDPEVISNQRHHSVDEAIKFLFKAIKDPDILKQVKEQLNKYFPPDINYAQLHNDVRYPFISQNRYNSLTVEYADAEEMMRRLGFLKEFLKGVDITLEEEERKRRSRR